MRKTSISYGVQSAQLKEIRRADRDGQGRHSFTAQQQTLRRLNDVFAAFCERRRAGKKPGYPRFKPYSRFDQVRLVAGDGAKWVPAGDDGWARARSRPWARSGYASTAKCAARSRRFSLSGSIAAGTSS